MPKLKHSVLGLAAALAMTGQGLAAEPVNLRFATVGVGSSWYNYGAGIAELLKEQLPEGSAVSVMPIAGGVGNMKLLQNKEAEVGFSFQTTAADGCRGVGAFDKPHHLVRGLVGGLDTFYFGTFVTEDSGVDSWDELAEGKVQMLATKPGGSGETAVRQVLALYDTTKEEANFRSMERAATEAAISDGSAAGWAHIVTRGHPVATQLTTTNDMKTLPLPDDIIQKMVSEHGWVQTEIPAGTFEGQDEPVKTVKAATNVMANADLPEDVAYTLTKTIVENAEKLGDIHAALMDFNPKEAANAELLGGCPLHPGAERYYKEAGLL